MNNLGICLAETGQLLLVRQALEVRERDPSYARARENLAHLDALRHEGVSGAA